MSRFQRKLWIGLGVLAVLSPLGLIIPGAFDAGGAWGEWGAGTLEKLLGYLPEGLGKTSGLWSAPVEDYSLGGGGAVPEALSYIVSGVLGIALAALIVYLIARLMIRK